MSLYFYTDIRQITPEVIKDELKKINEYMHMFYTGKMTSHNIHYLLLGEICTTSDYTEKLNELFNELCYYLDYPKNMFSEEVIDIGVQLLNLGHLNKVDEKGKAIIENEIESHKTFIKAKSIFEKAPNDFIEMNKEVIEEMLLTRKLKDIISNYEMIIINLSMEIDTFLENTTENKIIKTNYFMMHLRENNPMVFKAITSFGISSGIVSVLENGKINFNCDKGTVGLIFQEGGFSEWKTALRYVNCNNEPIKLSTLQNTTKNTPPNEWKNIKKILYP